jgi:hypothetical protein
MARGKQRTHKAKIDGTTTDKPEPSDKVDTIKAMARNAERIRNETVAKVLSDATPSGLPVTMTGTVSQMHRSTLAVRNGVAMEVSDVSIRGDDGRVHCIRLDAEAVVGMVAGTSVVITVTAG